MLKLNASYRVYVTTHTVMYTLYILCIFRLEPGAEWWQRNVKANSFSDRYDKVPTIRIGTLLK